MFELVCILNNFSLVFLSSKADTLLACLAKTFNVIMDVIMLESLVNKLWWFHSFNDLRNDQIKAFNDCIQLRLVDLSMANSFTRRALHRVYFRFELYISFVFAIKNDIVSNLEGSDNRVELFVTLYAFEIKLNFSTHVFYFGI